MYDRQEEEEEEEVVEEDVYDVSSGHRHALHGED